MSRSRPNEILPIPIIMVKNLVVEDDLFFRTYIQKSLEQYFQLKFAEDASGALSEILSEDFDLFLIDINLPGGNGLDICAFIKGQENLKNKPTIVLSSKDEVHDKVAGLEFGADDYLIKPCHPMELIARIRSHLRRAAPRAPECIQIAGYKIDLLKQRVYDPKAVAIELTHIEFKLLSYFVRHTDHVLSRNQILESVWHENLNVTERAVDTHVSNLRKKLGSLGSLIKSVHGTGYSFSIPRAA